MQNQRSVKETKSTVTVFISRSDVLLQEYQINIQANTLLKDILLYAQYDEVKKNNNENPLLVAAKQGHFQIIENLCKREKINIGEDFINLDFLKYVMNTVYQIDDPFVLILLALERSSRNGTPPTLFACDVGLFYTRDKIEQCIKSVIQDQYGVKLNEQELESQLQEKWTAVFEIELYLNNSNFYKIEQCHDHLEKSSTKKHSLF